MNSYATILNAIKGGQVEKAVSLLQSNIIEENARNAGTGRGAGSDIARLKIVHSWIDKAKDNNNFKLAHKQPSGKYIFTEGHIVFVSESDFGIENADPAAAYKFDVFFQNVNKADYITLDPAELKSFIKLTGCTRGNRGHNNKPYLAKSAEGVVIAFNPFFALDAIKYADTTKFYITKHNAPIYAENLSCMFLPINLRETINYDSWRAETFGPVAAAV